MSHCRLAWLAPEILCGGLVLMSACSSADTPPVPDAGGAQDAAVGADGSSTADGGAGVDAALPLPFGMGAVWTFDEAKGATASGAALHGAPAWTVGKINTALYLDGKSDSVETAAPALDNTQGFSVAAWVRLDRLDAPASILSLNGSHTSAVTFGYRPVAGAVAGGFTIAFAADDINTPSVTSVVSPFAPVADVWYHVAAVYDAAAHEARLYVGGKRVAVAPVTATFAGNQPTTLGRGVAAGAPALFWPGLVDEINLVDHALSDADVTGSYNAAAAITPVRPPATPLFVRSPYVSTWMQADTAVGNWPTFWTGAVKAITGIVRVDGTPYLFFGAPTGIAQKAQQIQLEVTATQSRFVFAAGGVNLYLDFVSPVEADDLRRLSMPFGFLEMQAVSIDGKTHATSVYLDISGEWAHGDSNNAITWSRADLTGSQPLSAFSIVPTTDGKPGEANDYPSWGTAVWITSSAGVRWQAGSDATVRGAFLGGNPLANTLDTVQPRAISKDWPVFAYEADLGMLGGVPSSPRLYALSNIRQPAASYLATNLPPLWQSYWSTWQSMIGDAFADTSMVARADAMDEKVASAAVTAGGAHYAALCALALRQAFGGVELANTSGDPWLFLKEISSDGNMQTVDVIYPAMPAFLYVNPLLVRYLLTPIFVYAESGNWTPEFAPHDLGSSYPNATAHNDGGGENMPVEESANMVLMAAAYLGAANNADAKTYVTNHYTVLKKWSDYLVANALDPGLQNQTDDFTGFIAHSSNLALKGILAIGAMGQIANTLGKAQDATYYTATAKSYIATWSTKSQDTATTHLKLAYDGDDVTWSLKYNSYPDRLLGLNLIPAATLAEESAWYAQQKNEYGFPLDNRHTYTKADWELWTAAGVSDPSLRQAMVDTLYRFADRTPSRVPFTDWYDTQTGTQNGFQARPVMGGLFSLLTLAK
jgi:hypothetical protein